MGLDIPPIVAIDSMILVWGIREQGTSDQCFRARWLLEQFTKRETQVIVSAMVLSEFLTALDPSHYEEVIAAMRKRYLLTPITPECAAIAAELFQAGSKLRVKGQPGGKSILRADTFVIAAARIHGAGRLYSNDGDCRDLANKKWPGFAHDVPVPPVNLFGQPIE